MLTMCDMLVALRKACKTARQVGHQVVKLRVTSSQGVVSECTFLVCESSAFAGGAECSGTS